MTNGSGAITYAKAYDPYGVVTSTTGLSQSAYGYTGEFTSQGLVYLRSRYYSSGMGRFLTRDTWGGNYNRPLSLNRWLYVEGNPINRIDPSGYCQRPDGSWDWFRWPWFGKCTTNTSGPTIPPSPTLIALIIATATACATPAPTSTNTPLPTLTPIPTLATGGLSSDDIRILALFVAAESSSGWVPADINYQKTWALLNKHSYDLAIGKNWSPFESWKHHERALLNQLHISGSVESQIAALLVEYRKIQAGGWEHLTAQVFAGIETTVRTAVSSWALNGSRSSADPVNGAVDFTDAAGLCFSDGGKGAKCKETGDPDNPYVEFGEMGNVYSATIRDPVTLEEWRTRFYLEGTTRVYQFSIDPLHNNAPVYTFTRFKQPDYPWP